MKTAVKERLLASASDKYQKNFALFERIVKELGGNYCVGEQHVRDTVFRELTYGNYPRFKFFGRFFGLVLTASLIVICVAQSIIRSLFRWDRVVSATRFDVVLDCGNGRVREDYHKILTANLTNRKFGYFRESILGFTSQHLIRLGAVATCELSLPLLLRLLINLLGTCDEVPFWLYLKLAFKAGKAQLLYKKQSGTVFISARDNYFDPITYSVLRKYYSVVILVQNGYRTGFAMDDGSLYMAADIYCGFGLSQVKRLTPNAIKRFELVGPVLLAERARIFYSNALSVSGGFDLLFIESDGASSEYFNPDCYVRAKKNFVRFALENPSLRASFVAKGGSIREASFFERSEISGGPTHEDFRPASNGVKDSYHCIGMSKVVIYYRSTLGIESLMFKKNILHCKYDSDLESDFPLATPKILVIDDMDYEAFSKSLNILLQNSDASVDHNYYWNMKYNLAYDSPEEIIMKYCSVVDSEVSLES